MFGTKPWMTLLWPGFPQLWVRGSWPALAAAVAAGGVLNAALLGTLVWNELLPDEIRSALWLVVGLVWAAGAVYTLFFKPEHAPHQCFDPSDDPFPKAVVEYLRGNWYEAERALGALVRYDVRDVQARLLLASLFRRTGRLEEAGRQLDALARFEAAEKWQLEIERERQQIHSKHSGDPERTDKLRPAA